MNCRIGRCCFDPSLRVCSLVGNEPSVRSRASGCILSVGNIPTNPATPCNHHIQGARVMIMHADGQGLVAIACRAIRLKAHALVARSRDSEPPGICGARIKWCAIRLAFVLRVAADQPAVLPRIVAATREPVAAWAENHPYLFIHRQIMRMLESSDIVRLRHTQGVSVEQLTKGWRGQGDKHRQNGHRHDQLDEAKPLFCAPTGHIRHPQPHGQHVRPVLGLVRQSQGSLLGQSLLTGCVSITH
jgi:hypothetical protein